MPYLGAIGGGGTWSHVPLTGNEVGAVAAFTGNNTATDLAGNHVLDLGTPAYVTNGAYGEVIDSFQMVNTSLLGTTGDTAHQIATANPVSFGGMFYINNSGSEATPYFISSSTQATLINYALVLDGGLIKYQTNGGLFNTTVFAPLNAWFHVFCVAYNNRTDVEVYLDGVEIYSNASVTAGSVDGTDELYIGTIDAAGGDFSGKCSDILVAGAQYTPAQVHTTATNAYGHALP